VRVLIFDLALLLVFSFFVIFPFRSNKRENTEAPAAPPRPRFYSIFEKYFIFRKHALSFSSVRLRTCLRKTKAV